MRTTQAEADQHTRAGSVGGNAPGASAQAGAGPVSGMVPGGAGGRAGSNRRGSAAGVGPGAAAAKAPPAELTGAHFASALLFLGMGAAGLVAFAPDLAAGRFLAPRVAGLTHLFTLGWITTSIMGALYQFLPVALDQPIRSERVAFVTLMLYGPGLLAFVTGLGTGQPVLMLGGAATFGTGVLLFVGNLAATLKRAVRRDVTWWALAFATLYLTITLVLGLALTGNLRWGYLGAGRINALGVHLHVALAGWVLLVIIGVAHRLLPMFLLSHGVRDHFAKAAVALVATGSGLLAFLHHAPALFSRWLPALCIALGVGAFLLQARSYYARRHRPGLDPGMRLAAGALVLLFGALLLSWPVVVGGAGVRLAIAYVMTALLGITLFVAAHYYKIVPFLVWYHRFGPLAGTRPVPRVGDLYAAGPASAAGVLLGIGALALIVSVASGDPVAARAGAVVFAAGVAIEITQMLQLWRKQP